MNEEQLEVLRKTIDDQLKAGIETHVNGKIRALTYKIDEYIKDDTAWKETAKPTIELGNNIRGFGKVFVYLLGIGATLFGIFKYLIGK